MVAKHKQWPCLKVCRNKNASTVEYSKCMVKLDVLINE